MLLDELLLTPEQIEREHTLARERILARRAAWTPEQIERERTLAQERTATRRASLSSEEIERQRLLATERTMTNRATASPIEAERKRRLTRERSAARRAAYTPEELKQQQELNRKRNRLQKKDNHNKKERKRGLCMSDDTEWPKPIEIERKTNCLRNFIQQMSMNFLAEGTCGICNVRCYKRDMHHVPLNKIPSIELLRVHNDLKHVISVMQETRS